MANVNRPRGFRPYGRVTQASPYVAGGTIYPHDAVKMNSDGKVVVCDGASDAPIGIAATYATSGNEVLVWDDPEQKFVVQADDGTTLAQTAVGLNYAMVVTSGDSTFRQSRMELDSSSGATDSNLPLRLIGFDRSVGNSAGEFADCIVELNLHQARKASEGL